MAVSSAVVTACDPATGASLTPLTVILKRFTALRSKPAKFVPPLSSAYTSTSAVPTASAAGVKLSVPAVLIAGPSENRFVLLLLSTKLTTCDDSLAGPAKISVANPATVVAVSSTTLRVYSLT